MTDLDRCIRCGKERATRCTPEGICEKCWQEEFGNNDLDRWLAESVMGWEFEDERQFYYQWQAEDYHFKFNLTDWHPTSDLNQAFMCMEKMREMGWDFYLSYYWDKTCIVSFHPTDQAGFSKSMTESRNNPALAICKAIKAAIS